MDFKDYFQAELAVELGSRANAVYPAFDALRYRAALPADFAPMEMKARVRVLAKALWEGLGLAFPDAAAVLCLCLDPIAGTPHQRLSGFPVWVIADIIETQGLEHFESAMASIHKVTQHFTGEFAIRPYLQAYPEQTLAMLAVWSRDPSPDVRRLVSEGTRSRLPWAARVSTLLLEPGPVLKLLEGLKRDDSEYVRRSVANNLNDISKDHPESVVATLEAWRVSHPADPLLGWIIRHALRTLAKRGHPKALALLGYPIDAAVEVPRFVIGPSAIGMGESILLDCDIKLERALAHGLMIDYAILAPGARGKINRRVFKWSKRQQPGVGTLNLQRSHRIETSQVRTYYPGEYVVELIINGEVMAKSHVQVHL